MLNDDEDIETMSVERLRELRDEVTSLIEQIGTRDVSVDPHAHEEIDELDGKTCWRRSKSASPTWSRRRASGPFGRHCDDVG